MRRERGPALRSVRPHVGGSTLAAPRVSRTGAALEPAEAPGDEEAGAGREAPGGYSRSAIIRSLISLVKSARVSGHGGSFASRY